MFGRATIRLGIGPHSSLIIKDIENNDRKYTKSVLMMLVLLKIV